MIDDDVLRLAYFESIDRFSEFVFKSTFLKRYKVEPLCLKKIRRGDEAELLILGFEWVRLFLWGHRPSRFLPQ